MSDAGPSGINTAVEQLAEARDQESFDSLSTLEENLAFHLEGHVNHSVFWPSMSPEGGDKPPGDLADAIDGFFGSFDYLHPDTRAVLDAGAAFSRWWSDSRPEQPILGIIAGGSRSGA